MKTTNLYQNYIIILTTFMLMSIGIVNGQETPLHYKLKTDIPLQECDASGTTTGFNIKSLPAGAKFSIADIKDDNYIIRFWLWDYNQALTASASTKLVANQTQKEKNALDNLSKRQKFNYANNTVTDTRYFLISKDNLAIFAEELIARFGPVFGAAVLPFKLRTQTNDWTKDLTISNLGGIKYNLGSSQKLSISALIGIGISSVTLDSTNTRGKVTESGDRAAITLPIGAVLQWQRLQFGVFMGWDWIANKNKENWYYHGMPWYSIGIGFAIFSEDNASKEEGEN